MLTSKSNIDGADDAVSATGTWRRISGAAKSVLAPIRKRLIGRAAQRHGDKASVVPLPKAGVAPEGLRLPAEVWFHL